MSEKQYNLKKHNSRWYIDKDGEALTNVDYLLKHDVEIICNELNNLANENKQLKQSEKDCQEWNHKLINENEELKQQIQNIENKLKRIEKEVDCNIYHDDLKDIILEIRCILNGDVK